jgi:hypothetical protein
VTLARLGLALALAAGACSGVEPGQRVACPPVLTVADAAAITQYRDGPGRDLTDIRFTAAIEDTFWTCAYDEDGNVDVEITVAMAAARGPAADASVARFSYFVALTDASQAILAKKVFPFDIPFEGNINAVGFQRVVGTTFYVGDDTTGAGHRIYLGFQLSEDQLLDNRRDPPGG